MHPNLRLILDRLRALRTYFAPITGAELLAFLHADQRGYEQLADEVLAHTRAALTHRRGLLCSPLTH